MAIKEKKFVDNQSKITSEMIDGESNENTLKEWQLVIVSNITEIQMHIDTAKGIAASEGKYLDPVKYQKMVGYRKVLGFLSQKIQHRLRELKYSVLKEKKSSIEFLFMEAAKNLLGIEEYERIRSEAFDRQRKLLN